MEILSALIGRGRSAHPANERKLLGVSEGQRVRQVDRQLVVPSPFRIDGACPRIDTSLSCSSPLASSSIKETTAHRSRMARRNGERLASAKAFITEHIRTGQDITVQQVQSQFADVATCRSIYRWIAQARAALKNPSLVNHRNLARQFISHRIGAGMDCRVYDVLSNFPGVARRPSTDG